MILTRELDLEVARAVGLDIIDRKEAIRLSNEHNDRQGPLTVGDASIPRAPWDSWYAHDWYIRTPIGPAFFGFSPVPDYRYSLGELKDLLPGMGVTSFRLDFDSDYGIDGRAGWSVSINGGVLVQFRQTAEEAVCLALVEWSKFK